MVESGQQNVVDIGYDNPDRVRAGIEVLAFDALRPRLKSSVAHRPSRLDFHQIMLVRGGEGTAMVDFVTLPCVRGTLLHLRPGQVQRLPFGVDGRPAELDATLLLFTADFLPHSPLLREMLDGFGPVAWRLEPDEFGAFERAVAEMEAEYRILRSAQNPDTATHPAAELTVALLRQLLGALLLRMARLTDASEALGSAASGSEVYLAFRRELEDRFATSRSVEEYAARLGYSPRTLTRACLAATGRSAKQMIDARVALQAQRLLAHTDLPVAAVGRAVGFTEATNFGKFFVRETGLVPGEFRRAQR